MAVNTKKYIMIRSTSTLAEWLDRQPIAGTRKSEYSYSIPDSLNLVDRTEAFRLSDYTVAGVSGGSIHFMKMGSWGDNCVR